jgi:hypothetical protein
VNAEAFVILVDLMRNAQRAYFKSRYQKDLIRSKQLERQVDQALEKGISFPSEPDEDTQIGMFVEADHDEEQP